MKYAYLLLIMLGASNNACGLSFVVLTGLVRHELNKRGMIFADLEAKPPFFDEFKRALCELYTLIVEDDLEHVQDRCRVLLEQWGSDPNKKSLIYQAYRDFFSIKPIV